MSVEPAATGQVVVAVPDTTGPAGDDEYTRPQYDRVRRRARSQRAMLWLLLIAVALEAFAALLGPPVTGTEITIICLVVAVLPLAGWQWRRTTRVGLLLGGHPWQPVEVEVLTGVAEQHKRGSCVVRGRTGQQQILRISRATWGMQQVILRTGRIWLCGPDTHGRALVRADGSCLPFWARVRTEAPAGPPPVRAEPTGPRPGEDPVVRWARTFGKSGVVKIWVRVGLIPLVFGGLAALGFLLHQDVVTYAFGFVAVFYLVVIGYAVLRTVTKERGMVKGLDEVLTSASWTPVPLRPENWQPRRNQLVGTATGSVRLPDGSVRAVEFPLTSVSLAANLFAGQTLWAMGELRPGVTTLVGLPGYPLLGRVKLREPVE